MEKEINNYIEKIKVSIGFLNADLGIVTITRPIEFKDRIYKSDNDRKLFPLKELIIENWTYNQNKQVGIQGYHPGSPVINFLWKFHEMNKFKLNKETIDACRYFMIDVIEDEIRSIKGFKFICGNYQSLTKDSYELKKEEKEKSGKFILFEIWETDEIWVEIGGLLDNASTVNDIIEKYCLLSKMFYDIYNASLPNFENMTITKEYKKHLSSSKKEISVKKIFISYSSKYQNIVEEILSKIKIPDFNLWFDKNEIKLGDFINKKIESGIKSASGFLFFVSEDINDKFYPRNELACATEKAMKDKNFFIIPILLDSPTKIKLPFEVANRRYIQLFDDNNILQQNIEILKYDLIGKSLKKRYQPIQ